ncbi:hypothetical protein QZH41_014993 [Actinostola sp. cb2023]|nr:hypothetical protein QZH41_014993 [Actinostola sp. cb2023]
MDEYEGRSGKIRDEDEKEYLEAFQKFDKDGSGNIEKQELERLLSALKIHIPNCTIRDLNDKYGNQIDFDEFKNIVATYSSAQRGAEFLGILTKRKVSHTGGTSHGSALGTTHSYSESEAAAFVGWINSQLEKDEELISGGYIPMDQDNNSQILFEKIKNGILLCKLINATVADTIDERVLDKNPVSTFAKNDNQTLAINSAISIGCLVVNIGPEDLTSGKPHLVLGLLWQIIRIGLFSHITISEVPGLWRLLRDGEDVSVLHKMSPEELLIRWVNYHLEQAGSGRRINNFGVDVKSICTSMQCTRFCCLLQNRDETARAEKVLRNADKIGCKKFVRATDIVGGYEKLNMAFVANLFNHYPFLPAEGDDLERFIDLKVNMHETREEKTYRNWMNSLGVNPFVTWLYTDLYDGHVLFQLYDRIHPGVVHWDKVASREACRSKYGGNIKRIENCNYALEIGKNEPMNLKLVAIGGQDSGKSLDARNNGTSPALMWQMMRAYTLSILSNLGSPALKDANEIIEWVNKQLTKGKKRNTIKDFKDPSISTSLAVIDLIDCISSKVIKYTDLETGDSEEEKLKNARYALSLARRIGAQIYALPEDLVEVKPKMVLTVFACLMACALKKENYHNAKKKAGRKY